MVRRSETTNWKCRAYIQRRITVPTHVVLGFMRRKVKQYVPPPMRCARCQRFRHHVTKCHRKQWCVRCGEEHDLENCQVKDNPEQIICVNCKGQHSAAYRTCSKYLEVSQTLKVAVNEGLSYKDALVKVHREETPMTSTPRPPKFTAKTDKTDKCSTCLLYTSPSPRD